MTRMTVFALALLLAGVAHGAEAQDRAMIAAATVRGRYMVDDVPAAAGF